MNPTLMTDQQTLTARVAQYLPYLDRFVGYLTRRDQMAEDIVQQTVLQALMHADQFRFESSLKAWLTSIATNEVRQAYRVATYSASR
jgi:DNA-directed RNA polymerase specialized sigma24 family protein